MPQAISCSDASIIRPSEWSNEAVEALNSTRLPRSRAGWRIVAALRVISSKLQQVEYIIHLLVADRAAAVSLLRDERPYERMFGDDREDSQEAVKIWHRLMVLDARLVLWHEDFYIHSAVLIDSLARFLFWTLPHPLRSHIPPRTFGSFAEAIQRSSIRDLSIVQSIIDPMIPVYQNTIRPIRDKAILHHRPPIEGFTSEAGYRCVVVDENRPDRAKLTELIKSEMMKWPDLSSYPNNEIELVSRLVAEGHPIAAKHADKLGVVGFAMPNPDPIWEAIQRFATDVIRGLPSISQLHSNPQKVNKHDE